MLSSMHFPAERWLHRCGGAVLLVSLVACADDNPVSPSASPVPSNPVTPSPKPAPPGAPGSVKLTLSRTDVVFNAMAGAALRDSAAVAVTAASGEAVSDLRAIVSSAQGKPADWLAVELDQTTLPAKLSLRARSPSLPPGEYTATVRLAAPGAAPESLSVTAHVASGPGIGLNATKICFTPTFTGPDARPDDVRITSLDGSPIDGLTAAVIYDPGQPTGWLSTSFTAPSAPARLWLTSQKGVTASGHVPRHGAGLFDDARRGAGVDQRDAAGTAAQGRDTHAQPGHRGSRRRGQWTPHGDGYRLRAHQWGAGRRLRGNVCSRDGGACDGDAGGGPVVLLPAGLPTSRAL